MMRSDSNGRTGPNSWLNMTILPIMAARIGRLEQLCSIIHSGGCHKERAKLELFFILSTTLKKDQSS